MAYPTNTLAMSSTDETRNRVYAIAVVLLEQDQIDASDSFEI